MVASMVRCVDIPSGLGWTPSFKIIAPGGKHLVKPARSGYAPTISTASLRTTPVTTIYVSTTGNNANSGLTPELAKRDFTAGTGAYSLISGATRIVVEAGDYYNDKGWRGLALTTETTYIEIVASGGRVRMLSQEASLTYASAGSGAYSATLATAPFGVYDEAQVDAYGSGTWLTQQANLAAVQASGGWYHDGVTTLYVKTFDARSPDRWVCAAQTGKNGFVASSAALTTYHSGVDWIGFVTGIYILNNSRTIVEDCRALGSQTNGFRIDTCTDAYLFRAEAHAAYNGNGFLYSAGNILEVDCAGLSNGWAAADTSNASTARGATAIRCGGVYLNSKGPNVAEETSSKSLTLGARLAVSRAAAGSQRTNVSSNGATGKVFLADCLLGGNGTQDIYTYNAGAIVYLRNTGYRTAAGVGTVTTW